MKFLARPIIIAIVFLYSAIALPAHTRHPHVHGHERQVEIYINDSIERMLAQFQIWEQTLSTQELDVEFLLGAGDLRRALLQMPQEGPGDLELFIHFNNFEFRRVTLPAALRYLKSKGVDLEKDLHTIFGEDKILDIFIKDAWQIRTGMPYMGHFGFFENMGDNSINRILYSPRLDEIIGEAEDLVSLSNGEIRFTEQSKASELSEPVKITGTQTLTRFKDTILRLALRSIRLEIDIALATNRNNLRLDSSFDTVLRGFELFFENADEEVIREFSLDEAYIEQFLKLFRKRTNTELVWIREFLNENYPRTKQILETMGLDVEALTKRITKNTDINRRELLATIHNSHYAALLPFFDEASAKTQNPFLDIELQTSLKELAEMRGLKAEAIKMLPNEIFDIYSPELANAVHEFDSLEIEEQLKTIKEYVSALKYFNQAAYKRVLNEKTFLDHYINRFGTLPIEELRIAAEEQQGRKKNKPVPESLLDYLTRNRNLRVESKAQASELRNEALENLSRQTISAGKTPVAFVDLDDTVFRYSSRTLRALRKYDEENGLRLFESIDFHRFNTLPLAEFLHHHLRNLPRTQRLSTIELLNSYVVKFRLQDQSPLEDEPIREVVEYLQKLKSTGVELVFLSARHEGQRAVTVDALAALNLPTDHVLLAPVESREQAKVFKVQKIGDFLSQNPDRVPVAIFEDKRTNIDAIKAAYPDLIGIQILQRFDSNGTRVELSLGEEDALRFYGLTCIDLL